MNCPNCNKITYKNPCVFCGYVFPNLAPGTYPPPQQTQPIQNQQLQKQQNPLGCIFSILIFSVLWGIMSSAIDRYKEKQEEDDTPTTEYVATVDDTSSATDATTESVETFTLPHDVIYDANDVKISITDNTTDTITFLIENNSEENYDYYPTHYQVNNSTDGSDAIFINSVPSHKKSTYELELSDYLIKDTIKSIDIIFGFMNDEYIKNFDTGIINIKATNDEYTYELAPGDQSQDFDFINISLLSITDNSATLKVINNGDLMLTAQMDNFYINDYSSYPLISSFSVFPHSEIILELELSSQMQENKIDALNEIGFSLRYNTFSEVEYIYSLSNTTDTFKFIK